MGDTNGNEYWVTVRGQRKNGGKRIGDQDDLLYYFPTMQFRFTGKYGQEDAGRLCQRFRSMRKHQFLLAMWKNEIIHPTWQWQKDEKTQQFIDEWQDMSKHVSDKINRFLFGLNKKFPGVPLPTGHIELNSRRYELRQDGSMWQVSSNLVCEDCSRRIRGGQKPVPD